MSFKKINITLFITFFIFSSSAFSQWNLLNSGTSSYLLQVQFPDDENTGYLMQDNNQILKTVDGGVNWNYLNSVFTPDRIFFLTKDTGFALAFKVIYKTTNGGNSWTLMYGDANFKHISMFWLTHKIGFVASVNTMGDTIKILKSVDAGNTWFTFGKIETLSDIPEEIYFKDEQTGFVSSYINSELYATFNGGSTWESVFFPTDYMNIYGIHFPSQDTGYAACDNYAIAKTVDGGHNWITTEFPVSTILYDLHFISNDTGFVVGGDGINSGILYKTVNGGQSWSQAKSTTNTLVDIYFLNNSTGYVCGYNGTVYKYAKSTVGLNKHLVDDFINIFPNPTTDLIFINSLKEIAYIQIQNMLGQTIEKNSNIKNTFVSLRDIPNGTYIVQIAFEDGTMASERVFKE